MRRGRICVKETPAQIHAPNFIAGIILSDDKAIDAAPIVRIAAQRSEAGRGTLAQLRSNALLAFLAAVRNLPQGITSDDPFSGAAQPAQMAHLAPWTAGKVFAAILANIAAGMQRRQIVAGAGSPRHGAVKLERYLRALLHQVLAVAASQQTLTSGAALNRLTAIRPRRSAHVGDMLGGTRRSSPHRATVI
jgi:hypothetical protein